MKSKTKHSVFFKGFVFAVALALMMLCFPMNAITALAASGDPSPVENYHILTIGDGTQKVKTTVNAGAEYEIPKAYIGGSEDWEIGNADLKGKKLANENITLVDSNVKVTYFGSDTIETSSDDTAENQEETNRDAYDGKFLAKNAGVYVVTYSYTYQDEKGNKTTNTYELDVVSTLSKASINFDFDNISLVPSTQESVIDYSYDKALENGKMKDVKIQLPKVLDEKGNEVDVKFYENDIPQDGPTNFVVITANGGVSGGKVDVSKNQNGEFYIDAESVFKTAGDATYTLKFSYYVRNEVEGVPSGEPQFVTSNTKSFRVYGTQTNSKKHYENYKLEMDLEADWANYSNGETGVEKELPKPIGLTSDDTKPAGEKVNVTYNVKVFYKSTFNGKYEDISTIKKTNDEGQVVQDGGKDVLLYQDVLNLNEEDTFGFGALKDPTKFKPLQNGYYSFVYTVKDFYGNTATNGKTAYEYLGTDREGIKDTTPPTPIVYDASVETENYDDIQDEDYKSRTYASANSVVVYAVGMKDSFSKHTDAGVKMSRRVLYDGVEQFVIEDYDDKNLIFNYRKTGSNSHAWIDLLTNNYNIRKEFTYKAGEADTLEYTENGAKHEIKTDAEMLDWLAKHNYCIVIDNANAKTIFDLFADKLKATDTSLAEADAAKFQEFLTKERTTDADKSEFEKYKGELLKLGFAYINVNKTFGYEDNKSGDDSQGFGNGTFKIQYTVQDAQNNEASKDVNISIVEDAVGTEAPKIKFETSLKPLYGESDVVSFKAPKAEDSGSHADTKMRETVLYRYLDSDKKPISLYKEGEDGKPTTEERETVDINRLWADLEDKWTDNTLLQDKYQKFHTEEDKYFDISNKDISTFEIDLSEVKTFAKAEGKQAKYLQIFVYAYDDDGNPGIYAEEVNISTTVDTEAPTLKSSASPDETVYYTGTPIVLNDLVFEDDAIGFMTYDIEVKYSSPDGKNSVTDPVVSGDSQSRNGLQKLYTVHPGQFTPFYAGTYKVTIKVADVNDNTIVFFQEFKVKQGNALVQTPQIKASDLDQYKDTPLEIEGDENYDPATGIEIPVPRIDYNIPYSVTYDEFKQSPDTYKGKEEYQLVVWGVKENGYADTNEQMPSYSVNYGENGRFFPQPLKKGEKTHDYDIQYTAKVLVWDLNKFTFSEDDGTLSYQDPALKITFLDEKDRVEVEKGETKYVLLVNNDNFVVYGEDGKTVKQTSEYQTDLPENVVTDLKTLRNYILESDVYRITFQDTIAPDLVEYSYQESYSVEEIQEKGYLDIKGIQLRSSTNDLDLSRCRIDVYCTLPSGKETGRDYVEGSKALEGFHYDKFPTDYHGNYTIEYTVWDIHDNKVKEDDGHKIRYTITVGDMTPPTIEEPEDFLKDTYKIDEIKEDGLTIDLSRLTFHDDGVDKYNANVENDEDKFVYAPTATLKIKSSNSEEVEPTSIEGDGMIYHFPIELPGSYVLTITVKDEVGNSTPYEIPFEVVSDTKDTTMTYQVIGTVLIVISVLVLAGVIIYFIVSKVKLDKELKK